ncbi:bifunctional demethylmenaquinone methyltransferase/2-methoxy-6-polyprenyl-1,4-benzoquinol methylase UbiE [Terrihabitans sp. B22-R8]|uniref:bifunctional demethylmenaquinone methyltransferase/2-methoxy-6-polyprenyl-1,4-benzoquinol methylase UbiE n=1 Tax=Terrihabitans sp. B22-R8 TaxID=3425128 RepID=UPI00403CB954
MSDRPGESETTHFGFEDVALGDKQGRVNEVFHGVAQRYDVMNDLMSGGLHRAWKQALLTELNLPRGPRRFRLLDVAGGTGDIGLGALKRGGPGVHVTLFDINPSMLEVGRERAEARGLSDRVEIFEGNAEELPFDDCSFEAVTIAFGLRNVPRMDRALAEARRVLVPGGRFFCLEFSKVDAPVLDRVYDLYSFKAIPHIGRLVAGDGEPYRYLVESIRRFPPPEELAGMMRTAGLSRVAYTPYTGGIAALHTGWRL